MITSITALPTNRCEAAGYDLRMKGVVRHAPRLLMPQCQLGQQTLRRSMRGKLITAFEF